MHAKVFSIQYFRQIPPRVCTLVLFICIGEHLSGPEIAAVIRSRGVAAKQGFLMTSHNSKGDAIGDQGSLVANGTGSTSYVYIFICNAIFARAFAVTNFSS